MIVNVLRNTGILFVYYGESNWFLSPDIPEMHSKGTPETSSVPEEPPEVDTNELDTAEVTTLTEGEPVVPEVVSIEVAEPQGPGV